jgi:methylenetetrahydrofolate--tRNA-(uracil-5-)-methyltransferase
VIYICHADAKNFQPAYITFDLLQPIDEETRRRIRDKKQRHAMVCERALAELELWLVSERDRRAAAISSPSAHFAPGS